jgi:ATP-dependent Clp protease ATP-binding subunit ClpC
LLTDAVRQQPFSVVLLDEIEKAHINVFDLCLQVFDAGRLTDGRGRTIDFRSTILILTSNVGATAPSFSQLGFKATPEEPSVQPDADRTFRELARCFRPEFLNRLDRIVNFRALTLEVAESIARREVVQVLRRSGINRRGLQVDIDPAVLAVLVKEGYSPHFGARPLKRAVERLVLLPLGRWIASGRGSAGSLLRLVPQGDRIAVSEIRRAEPARAPRAKPTGEERLENVETLLSSLQTLEAETNHLATRKSRLLALTQEPGFYQDAKRRTETFDEIHKLEEILSLQRGLRSALESVQRRSHHGGLTPTDQEALGQRLEELSGELDQLRAVAACQNTEDLGDALVCLTLVHQNGEAQRALETLAEMYLAFGRRRHMDVAVLAERYGDKEEVVFLEVAGLGALGLLKQESGLHEFERRFRTRAARTGKEVQQEDTEMVRVEIVPFPLEIKLAKEIQAKVQTVKPAKSRLVEKADLDVSVFHQPSLRSLRGWTRGPRPDAIARLSRILAALVASGPAVSEPAVVRRYSLGTSPRIKDYRSGRTVTRVERVLKGHLELLGCD